VVSGTATNSSNALGAHCGDTGTATTAPKALGALWNTRAPNVSSKALGALAVALRDIRRTSLRRIVARRDDHGERERRKTFLLVSLRGL